MMLPANPLQLVRARRARLGTLLLALMALIALFAEWLCASVPVYASGPDGVELLPAVTAPEQVAQLSPAELQARYEGQQVVWPLHRWGPDKVDAPELPISNQHPLGTDSHGRDVLARLVYGTRSALGVALIATLLGLLLGGLLGALAGYYGRGWDELSLRPVELVAAFPAILVVVLLAAVTPPGSVWALLAAATLLRFAESVRLLRAEVLRLSYQPFVRAAVALGCPPRRVLLRHILPHALGPIAASSMFGIGTVVVLETAAAFLGVGAPRSWGAMIAQGFDGGSRLAAWSAVAALATTMGASYLLADAVGEALDRRVAATGNRRI